MNLLASMRYLVALRRAPPLRPRREACHITQPALSNALRALEAEFGVVDRQARPHLRGPDARRRARAGHGATACCASRRCCAGSAQRAQAQPRGTLRMAAVPTAIPMRRASPRGCRRAIRASCRRAVDELARDRDRAREPVARHRRWATPSACSGELKFTAWPQYDEHYFLLRRVATLRRALRLGAADRLGRRGALPLCLLTPEMHNRTIVDRRSAQAGAEVAPAIETNSVLTRC